MESPSKLCDFSELRALLICDSSSCGTKNPSKCCTQCKAAYYCSRECQRAHWMGGHKRFCQAFAVKHSRNVQTMDPTAALETLTLQSRTSDTSNDTKGEFATCGICLVEEIERPVVLPCQHKFCFACISELQGYHTVGGPSSNECPYCRTHMGKYVVESALDHAQELIQKAGRLYHNGFTEQALPLFRLAYAETEKILETGPTNVSGLIMQARCLLPTDPHRSIALCREIFDIDRIDSVNVQLYQSRYAQCVAATHAGDVDRANALANEIRDMPRVKRLAMGLLPFRRIAYHEALAEAYYAAQWYREAYREYETLLTDMRNQVHGVSLDDKSVYLSIHKGLSRNAYHLQNYTTAIEWMAPILARNRNLPGLHKLVALPLMALAQQGGAAHATTVHGHVVSRQSARMVMYHGWVYEDQGDAINKRANRLLLEQMCDTVATGVASE